MFDALIAGAAGTAPLELSRKIGTENRSQSRC